LVRYFFLKRPKIEISENLRFSVRRCVSLLRRSTNVPNACTSSVAGIHPELTRHRSRGRNGDYRANERAEGDQPKICSHGTYLKHPKIDISQNVKYLSTG